MPRLPGPAAGPRGGRHSGRTHPTRHYSRPLPPSQGRTHRRTPALRDARSERPAVSLPRLSHRGPPEPWAQALTHARTQTPAPPPLTRLQECSHSHTHIHAHALAHTAVAAWTSSGRRSGPHGHEHMHTLKCSLTHTHIWHTHNCLTSRLTWLSADKAPLPAPPAPHPNSPTPDTRAL